MANIKDTYTKAFFLDLGSKIQKVYPKFDTDNYVKEVFCPEWDSLEFMARVNWSAKCLKKFLTGDYERDIAILLLAAPSCSDIMQCSVLSEYIPVFGLEYFEVSMKALSKMTPYWTSEFAVRPFIEKYKAKAIAVIALWCEDPDENVRRLASEGLRIAIPWGSKLKYAEEHPEEVILILDKLKNDPSEYVRKSVANNINEMSKKHPDLVIKLAKEWYGQTANVDKMLKHGCRTLLKKGNSEILKLFGMASDIHLNLLNLEVSSEESDSEKELTFRLTFELFSDSPEKLLLQCELCSLDNPKIKTCVKLAEKKFNAGVNDYFRKIKLSKALSKVCGYGPYSVKLIVNGVIL